MKVHYDHQAFTIQNFGGISRYFIELFNQLKLASDLELKHTPQFSNNEYLAQYAGIRHFPFLNTKGDERKQNMMRYINNLIGTASLATGRYSVFHPTYYDPYFLRLKSRKPFVVTFHDMIHEHFQKVYPELNTPLILHKKLLLEKSAAIISVSESTKRDILTLYPHIPADKINVIPLASSLQVPVSKPIPAQTADYLLYVGTRSLYKNFMFFVEAITPLLQRYKHLKLLCAGGGSFTMEEQRCLAKLQVQEQVQQVPITDERLAHLYAHALAFVFPSLYEGFGIPTIEAMSCGCPVLASEISSIPEVGADAALYFSPTDPDSIRHAVEQVITNSSLRQELITKGYNRAAAFSWNRTAELTKQVYHQLQ